MAQHAAPAGAPPVNRRSLLTLASIAVALAAADTYVVVLALTDMMAGVGIGIDALQEATPIISGFLLGYIAVLPLIGRLSDVLDRQRILLGCLIVFIIGSAITALAVDMSVLVTGRVLQGIGGGGLVPATLALVADLWPADRRGAPLGVVGAVQELGSVLGPVLGAVILAIADWRMIFWVNVVFAAVLYAAIALTGRRARLADRAAPPGGRGLRIGARVVALLAVVVGVLALWAPERLTTDITLGAPFVPFSGDSRVLTPIGVVALGLIVLYAALTAPRWWAVLRQLDLFGALLIAIALGALVLTFSSSDPEKEVVGPLGLTLLPVGAVALLVLAWWHRKAKDPLIPRGVLHRRGITALVVSLLVGASLVAVIVDVPLLTRLVEGKSATDGALVLVRFLVAVPVGALLGGWLLRRVGDGMVAGVGLVLAAIGMFFMSRWTLAAVDAQVSTTLVLVLVGFGVGLALAPVNNSALADSPADAHGIASSLVVVARMVGMVVGLALLTAIGLNRYFDAVRALPNPTDTTALIGAGVVQVQTVFLGGALAALLGGLIAFTMGLRRNPSDTDAAHVRPLSGI